MRWILHDVYCKQQYECSNCGAKYVQEDNVGCDQWEYCPNCGQRNIINNHPRKRRGINEIVSQD